jgi:hypothetical protein
VEAGNCAKLAVGERLAASLKDHSGSARWTRRGRARQVAKALTQSPKYAV